MYSLFDLNLFLLKFYKHSLYFICDSFQLLFQTTQKTAKLFWGTIFPSSKKCNPAAYRCCQLYKNITVNVKTELQHAVPLLLQKVNYWHAKSNYYTVNPLNSANHDKVVGTSQVKQKNFKLLPFAFALYFFR